MGRKDKIYQIVKNALEQDGWIVIKEALTIELEEENRSLEIDLAAEKVIIAEKQTQRIAVEIKSFAEPSILHTFHKVLGQYLNYRDILSNKDLGYEMMLAIPDFAYVKIDESPFMKGQMKRYSIKGFVIDIQKQIIKQWINI